MTITELSIKRPILVVVFFSFLGVLGIFGFTQLKYELTPKIDLPIVVISTTYAGASPNEIETSVTKVIEDVVTGIDNVKTVSATSYESQSIVVIEFNQGTEIDFALQDVQRKVNQASFRLPEDAFDPVLSKIAMDEMPILWMGVTAKMNSKDLYQFVIDKVQPRISKIGGVGNVILQGGEQREIRVNIDENKLRSYGLSLFAVTNSIGMSNMDFPTGNIYSGSNQYTLRIAAKFTSVNDLRELVIGKSRTGNPVKLKEVADVFDGIKDITTIYRINGDNSIGLIIQKQNDANTVEVSQKVREEIKKLEQTYGNIELKFNIAQDGSIYIMNSANAVKFDLALAIIIVALIMLIFLHSIRNSLIILVAIPSSLVVTFFLMYIFGFTLNMMTLLAMSLVIGILVDDSIVVIENIHHHLEKGKDKATAALVGRNEIGFAALSITLVDVVVFVPIAMITGIVGNFLRQYALVIVMSTLMSLLVSFTITPMLASRFSKLEDKESDSIFARIGRFFEKYINKLINLYSIVLKWSLNNGGKVVIGVLLLLSSTILLFRFGLIGFEFMPKEDNNEINVSLEVSAGTSIEKNNEITRLVEERLSTLPYVEKIITSVGSAAGGMMGISNNSTTSILVKLIDKTQRLETTALYSQKIKNLLSDIPGLKTKVAPGNSMGGGGSAPIQILVTGNTYDEVMRGANKIKNIVESVEGTYDVALSTEESKPEIRVEVDRDKLSALGLSIAEVGQTLQIALTGNDNSKYRDGINEYDIRIMLDKFDRNNPDNVRNLTFMNSRGQMIYLNQFATITQTVGPTKLERTDRMRAIKVNSQIFGQTSGVIAGNITAQLENIELPQGVNWRYFGEQENMGETMSSMVIAVFIAILFVYMIMVALYNSFLYPFVVLFSIPLALIGAFLGLAITMNSISIYSMLGMIMLIGLVAKNAILIVDRANQARIEGHSTFEALMDAGRNRFRPILMTTLAMVFGMLPIALSNSAGSEGKNGLAIVLIGGLSSSLILTLLLVPVIYQKFVKIKENLVDRLHKKKKSNTNTEISVN